MCFSLSLFLSLSLSLSLSSWSHKGKGSKRCECAFFLPAATFSPFENRKTQLTHRLTCAACPGRPPVTLALARAQQRAHKGPAYNFVGPEGKNFHSHQHTHTQTIPRSLSLQPATLLSCPLTKFTYSSTYTRTAHTSLNSHNRHQWHIGHSTSILALLCICSKAEVLSSPILLLSLRQFKPSALLPILFLSLKCVKHVKREEQMFYKVISSDIQNELNQQVIFCTNFTSA